jgi:ATP-dependent DNA ligase I
MTLAKFANMCEVLELKTPTQKRQIIAENMSAFEDRPTLIEILSLEYSINNIGIKRATVWCANALGLFEDEINTAIHMWGDLGEGMNQYYEGDNTTSDISLLQFKSLLDLNCSSINNRSFVSFSDNLKNMSALEKKWFLRYWLRKPRNGVNNKVPLKAMQIYYTDSNIEQYYKYNTAKDICESLESGTIPESRLVFGHFISPMLAKPRKGKEIHKETIVDIKYDGNRYQIHKENNLVIIFNRKGKIVTPQYADIADIVSTFKGNLIMDCEIYPVNPDGSPAPHKLLAKRVHKKNKEEAIRECPVKLVVFDLLFTNGVSLIDTKYKDRYTKLIEDIPKEYQAKVFPLSEYTIQAAYNIAISEGFEGVMIKDALAEYHAGKRSKAWLKYKPPRISLDVVITSAKYGEGKRSHVFGTYGISVVSGNDYIQIGSIGTGFTDLQLLNLTTDLKKNIDRYSDTTFYFLPRVVLEITADLISQDDKGNIGLRFPRLIRIRNDKFVKDADTIQQVIEMM